MKYHLNILSVFVIMHISMVSAQDANEILTRGAALRDRSEFEELVTLYTEAMNTSDDYRLYVERGEALLKTGRAEDAITDFKRANGLQPGSGYLGLARAYASLGEREDAISQLKHHLESAYKRPRKEILLDSYFASLEKSPEWRQLWKTSWYTMLEEAGAEIEYLVEEGRLADARKVLAGVDGLYRDQPEINYLKGVIAAADNDTKAALQYLAEAVEGDRPAYKTWELYVKMLARNGDYLKAAATCQKVLREYPGETSLIIMRSDYLRRAGDRERALAEAEAYRELYPGDEEATRQAAVIAAETGDYNKALRYFSENVDNYPGKPECFTDRADTYLKMKSWDAAVYDYSMALDLWPRNGEAYYNKGLALFNMGKTEEACHDFRMALSYGIKKASGMLGKYCIK